MVHRGQKPSQQDIASPSLAVEGEGTETRVWRSGPRILAANLAAIARPAARKFGFADARLLSDWALIVGEALARLTLPLAVHRNKTSLQRTLLLKCSAATAPLVQHYTPQILERVNGYYGFAAIARLRIKQSPLPLPPVPSAALPPLSAERTQALHRQLSDIESEAIRTALFDLGQQILR